LSEQQENNKDLHKVKSEKSNLDTLIDDIDEILESLDVFPYIEGYIKKLKNLKKIYYTLQKQFDTEISMVMFERHFIAFVESFKNACEIVEQTDGDWDNIILNLINGINYLYQFIKVVHSVNHSSFQSPKYEPVQDECNVSKMLIAYSQFLSDVFRTYYEKRVKFKDSEHEYFPRYMPLIIPFMTDNTSFFQMRILFQQGLSDDWTKEVEVWKEYVKKNYTPLFVTCQDFYLFTDVSYVIASSFHELGHYCNGISREDRNLDMIEILSYQISTEIIKQLIECEKGCTDIHFGLLKHGLNENVALLCKTIATKLREEVTKQIKDDCILPYNLFVVKLINEIKNVLIPSAYSKKILFDNLKTKLINDLRYQIDFSDKEFLLQDGKDIHNILHEAFKQMLDMLKVYIESVDIKVKEVMSNKYYEEAHELKEIIGRINFVIKRFQENLNKYNIESMKKWEDVYENVVQFCTSFNTGIVPEFDIVKKHRFRKNIKLISFFGEAKCEEVTNEIFHSFNMVIDVVKLMSEYAEFVYDYDEMESDLQFKDSNKDETDQDIKNIFKDIAEDTLLDIRNDVKINKNRVFKLCLKFLISIGLIHGEKKDKLEDKLIFAARRSFNKVDTLLHASSVIYCESFADSVMCNNLKLTSWQYLCIMAEYVYPISKHSEKNGVLTNRMIVVLISIIYDEIDGNVTAQELINKLRHNIMNDSIDMHKDIHALINKDDFQYLRSSDVLETIKKLPNADKRNNKFAYNFLRIVQDIMSGVDVLEEPYIRVILNRIISAKERYVFASNVLKGDIINNLKNKISNRLNNWFGCEPIKEDFIKNEIEFILEYYYKNRFENSEVKNHAK